MNYLKFVIKKCPFLFPRRGAFQLTKNLSYFEFPKTFLIFTFKLPPTFSMAS
jgi:hypothetical protein